MRDRLAWVVLVAVSGVALAAPPSKKFLSPPELMKLIEASPLEYAIHDEPNDFPQWRQQNASQFWPQALEQLQVVKLRDGKVVPVERAPEVSRLLEKVEPLYEAKDFEGAAKGYEAILARFPDEYGVLLDHGDAALFGGKPQLALERYLKAGKLNAADHRSWFYRANAYAALGKKQEALDAYAEALARAPTNPVLNTAVEATTSAMGGSMRPRVFFPAARVTKSAQGYQVTIGKKGLVWLGWGLCKAAWRGEPSHRKAITGDERDRFSIEEEKECLVQLASLYEQRADKEERDPVLEQFLEALKADLLNGFLMFEIVTRVDPHAFLRQEPAVQKQTVDYVRRFVLRVK